MFSLSNKDKFILQNTDKAVRYFNQRDYGPAFGGGHDFVISHKGN